MKSHFHLLVTLKIHCSLFLSSHPKCWKKINFLSTLNRLGFSESGKARGRFHSLCNFPIWRPMPMNFGSVILSCQKFYHEIKHLVTSWGFYKSFCILGSVRVKGRKSKLFCFSSNLLEFWHRGSFEMLITKRKPKVKLENDSSKRL